MVPGPRGPEDRLPGWLPWLQTSGQKAARPLHTGTHLVSAAKQPELVRPEGRPLKSLPRHRQEPGCPDYKVLLASLVGPMRAPQERHEVGAAGPPPPPEATPEAGERVLLRRPDTRSPALPPAPGLATRSLDVKPSPRGRSLLPVFTFPQHLPSRFSILFLHRLECLRQGD